MEKKHRSLFLFLTIACFVGLILVFVFDGYMGVYDSLVIDNKQYPQTIEPDQWEQRFEFRPSTYVERGSRIEFTYKVDNHSFSPYSADVQVSFLHNDEAITEPLVLNLAAESFGSAEVNWVMDVDAFVPEDYPEEQGYNINIFIEMGKTKREVLVNIASLPAKPVIIESIR